MPVDTQHSEYDRFATQWREIRDALAGEAAVKAAGTAYLPQLNGQKKEAYIGYKARAMFYGATGRTHEGLMGALFLKDPVYSLPSKVKPFEESVDLAGTTIGMFASNIASEVLAVGRVGILTEYPEPGAPDQRPYFVTYSTEQITNWRRRVIRGKTVVDQIILNEVAEEVAEDSFGSVKVERYRVLELIGEEGSNPKYTVSLYKRKKDSKTEWELDGDPRIPTRRGESLDFIPFICIGPHELSLKVAKPPLYDLASVNMSHYRTSADLEHGCHWTALPTPWVFGLSDTATSLHIGSQVAWILPMNAEAGMLEFTGAGLSALETRLVEKQALMARLGARLLEDQKKAAETAESKRLDYSGDNSVLSSIANSVSEGIRRSLDWANMWAGGGEAETEFELNKDFFDMPLEAQEVVNLVAAWQSGGMPIDALYWNLHQGERLPNDMTLEDYKAALEAEGPSLAELTAARRPPAAPDEEDEDTEEEDEAA
jgi:hypothetical protein